MRSFAEVAIPCTYCGLPADAKDHVIPRAVRGYVPPDWLASCPDTVPVCTECNSIASDRIVCRTVEEKRREIHDRLRSRYRQALAREDWSPDGLSELGDRMRQHVLEGLRERDLIRQRLAWGESAPMERSSQAAAESAQPEMVERAYEITALQDRIATLTATVAGLRGVIEKDRKRRSGEGRVRIRLNTELAELRRENDRLRRKNTALCNQLRDPSTEEIEETRELATELLVTAKQLREAALLAAIKAEFNAKEIAA